MVRQRVRLRCFVSSRRAGLGASRAEKGLVCKKKFPEVAPTVHPFSMFMFSGIVSSEYFHEHFIVIVQTNTFVSRCGLKHSRAIRFSFLLPLSSPQADGKALQQ